MILRMVIARIPCLILDTMEPVDLFKRPIFGWITFDVKSKNIAGRAINLKNQLHQPDWPARESHYPI